MKKIGIFYAPKGGSTEKVANKIHSKLSNSELNPVPEASVEKMMQYDYLVMGIATLGKETWDQDVNKSGWDYLIPRIEEADFTGKKIALFGLGDSVTYDLHFVDAMGVLGKKLQDKGATLIGFVNKDDYNFRDSQAIQDGKFMGLPIDEDFEEEKTDERIANWVMQISNEML